MDRDVLDGNRDGAGAGLLRWLQGTALPVALVLSLAFFAVACSPLPRVDVQQPTTAKAAPTPRIPVANGAIFQTVGYRPLFEDPRPRFVGDILTRL